VIRYCIEPQCKNLVTYRGRCPTHSKDENRRQHSNPGRMYSTRRWQILRRHILERDGYTCVDCGAFNANEVDHITPWQDGGAKWDQANLITRCKRCHSEKTMLEVKARTA
jgi:5-methylcytosine-specific restriction enzyme A